MWLNRLWDMFIGWIAAVFQQCLWCLRQIAHSGAMFLLGLLLAMSVASGAVIRVDGTSGNDSNDGFPNWSDALATIEEAFSRVNPGDEIWVASSATPYTPSVPLDPNTLSNTLPTSVYGSDELARKVVFNLVKNVGIYGGFLGNATGGGETTRSQADPVNNVTILSGDLGKDGHAYHVLLYYQDSEDEVPPNPLQFIIDGFVITGGNANGGDDNFPYDGPLNAIGGGALIVFEEHENLLTDPDEGFLEARGPVFSRCVFENNSAEAGGGAIAGVYNGGRVIDCTFRHNTQTAPSETGTQFGKTTNGGGAIAVLGPVAILRSTFIENESATIGGGDYHIAPVTNDDVVLVSNCRVPHVIRGSGR